MFQKYWLVSGLIENNQILLTISLAVLYIMNQNLVHTNVHLTSKSESSNYALVLAKNSVYNVCFLIDNLTF